MTRPLPETRAGALLLALLFGASALVAQVPAPARLVHLYPVALDANGQPVLDLSSDDFKITDQGKPQNIFYFRAPHARWGGISGPAEYSNRPRGWLPHSVAIVFDLMNQLRSERVEAWHKLAPSLAQLESGDSVFFYAINPDGELIAIHGAGPQSATDNTWPRQIEQILDALMKSAGERAVELREEEQVKKTYQQLETVANQLAAVPGRGDIIWITGGVPNLRVPNAKQPCDSDWVDCGLYVPYLALNLERDNVAISPLCYATEVPGSVTYDLQQLARLTGGHPYYGDDIRDVLKQVARNAANAYEIAYDPGAENWDKSFHWARMTCRNKEVKLHARQRYYAVPDSRSPEERRKDTLMAADQNPGDAAGIGLLVKVSPAGQSVHLEIRIDPSDILLRNQGGRYAGAVTFLLSDRGAPGRGLRPLGDPMVSSFLLNLTPDQREKVIRDGIPISRDHAISPAVERVRLVVLDESTNEVGSVTFPIR